jgi:cytochrome c oxidase assembly protein subunit 15
VQAVVGGLRVLLDRHQVAMVDTSLGRIFAMLHACLAQVFACTLIAIAAALSRPWIERARREPARSGAWLRRGGIAGCVLLLTQTAIAAVMRHSFAGLAIPTFPFTPEGGLVPVYWDFRIGVNFAHRAMALVVTVAVVWFAATSLRARETSPSTKVLAVAIVALLAAQVALGASIVWTGRNPYVATAHVLVGAVTLAATFLLTWLAHRDMLESVPDTAATVPLPGAAEGKPVPA